MQSTLRAAHVHPMEDTKQQKMAELHIGQKPPDKPPREQKLETTTLHFPGALPRVSCELIASIGNPQSRMDILGGSNYERFFCPS